MTREYPPDLERPIRALFENPDDMTALDALKIAAKRRLSPAQMVKLWLVDLWSDGMEICLGELYPKLVGQETLARALSAWLRGDGRVNTSLDNIYDHTQGISRPAWRNTPSTIIKALNLPRHPTRLGTLTETKFVVSGPVNLHPSGMPVFAEQYWPHHSNRVIYQINTRLDVTPEGRDIHWRLEPQEPLDASYRFRSHTHWLYVARAVYCPPSSHDLLAMVTINRPPPPLHPASKQPDLHDPGPFAAGDTQSQYLFVSANQTLDITGERSIIRWGGWSFRGRKFYSGAVNRSSRCEAVAAFLDALDLCSPCKPREKKPVPVEPILPFTTTEITK